MNSIHHRQQPNESDVTNNNKSTSLEYFGTFTTDLPDHNRRKRNIYSPSYQNSFSSSSSTSNNNNLNNNHNNEYTIEVLVAVDKKMQEKHGENLQEYVLTLMSTVRHF